MGGVSNRTGQMPVGPAARPVTSAPPPAVAPAPMPPPAAMPQGMPPIPVPTAAMPVPAPAPAPMPAPAVRATPSRIPPRESPAAAARRLALVTLVDRAADAADLAPLRLHPMVDDAVAQRLGRTIRDQAQAMRSEGEVPEGIDVEQLVRDASRELVGLGPIGPLLEEDDVTEIHCIRHDHVLYVRAGQVQPADVSFTSEEALGRAIARLAHQHVRVDRLGQLGRHRRGQALVDAVARDPHRGEEGRGQQRQHHGDRDEAVADAQAAHQVGHGLRQAVSFSDASGAPGCPRRG